MKFIPRLFLILGLIIALSIFGCYFFVSPKYAVPILMYHHIDENGKTSSMSVSPENFARQIHFLSRRNYNVISLAELIQAKLKQRKLPRNTVVITFDDGCDDNYTSAYPVLKKYNLPATIFVIVDFIGREGYLNDTQIGQMLAGGLIDIGSHSLTHSFLPAIPQPQLEQEIGLSKKILETRLGKRIDYFCYPLGHFSPKVEETVKKYGYLAACTTNRGNRQTCLNDDLFALKRIKIKDGWANLFVFWVKISGYYNLFRRVRQPY